MKSFLMKQLWVLIFFILFTYVGNMLIDQSILTMGNMILKQFIVFLSISIILFACNQLLYNYARKNPNFMKHPVWNKMFVFIFIWLMISFILLIAFITMTSLGEFLSEHAWLMFVVIYYFLFFINLFVLSLVHKLNDSSITLEKKLLITWISSSALIAIILFMFPSI